MQQVSGQQRNLFSVALVYVDSK